MLLGCPSSLLLYRKQTKSLKNPSHEDEYILYTVLTSLYSINFKLIQQNLKPYDLFLFRLL